MVCMLTSSRKSTIVDQMGKKAKLMTKDFSYFAYFKRNG